MSEICPKCGLPKALCVCETIAKEDQEINVMIEKRKFGKMITVVKGLDKKAIDIKEVTKKLKSALACGGTTKGDVIELQGHHLAKVKKELVKLGFDENSIK
ncbi:MAG: stress response translation initiation inhibitor YciH [Candidatus Nanoarchaeia archaeon]|nr:stress response translation initiation inhibitor YciH [Candidatus Nanoarchaeia archaeon]